MSSRVSFDNSKKYMETDKFNADLTPKQPATPINIPTPAGGQRDSEGLEHRRKIRRRRRDSEASSSLSSLSETFSSESPSPTTPPAENSPTGHDERMSPEIATSPILSYFMAHASPIKSASDRQFWPNRDTKPKMATSPGPNSTLDEVEGLPHVLHHARRMSQNWDQTKTIGIQQKSPPTGDQQQRNASLMRRLSLSSQQTPSALTLSRSMDSKSLLSPVPAGKPSTTTPPRRSATISQSGPIRRPPSPMGERMLKGDFHGF